MPGTSSASRDDIEPLVAHYLELLTEGELLDPDEIRARHADVADTLLATLELFVGERRATDEVSSLGTIGDYTLVRQIGRGGMGIVYEAWENSMDRAVALKVLPAGAAADDRTFQRFLLEAKTAGKLGHPNIVPVYFTGVKDQTPFYSMELVHGETLAQLITRLRDAEPETETPFGKKDRVAFFGNLASAFADVADGLQHAHSKGVVHRDVKPSNLILDASGRLRILDFGLARLEGHDSLTLSGDFIGTPLYMSPEQARRRKIPVDHRTDVYSLGATMYETLCGRPPFRGRDHADTLTQIIERDPLEPRVLNARVPRDLETIVLKCLRKDAGERYGTAEALGQDLRRFVRGDPIEAKRPSRFEVLRRSVWRWRRPAILGALLLLVASSGLAWMAELARRDDEARDARYREIVRRSVGDMSGARFPFRLGHGLVAGRQLMAGKDADLAARPRLIAAVDELDEAIALFPDRPSARYLKAKALSELRREDAALGELGELLARQPGFVPALVARAYHRALDGEEDRTEGDLDEASALGAGWGRTWLEAIRALEGGEWELADGAFSRLLSDPELRERQSDARAIGVFLELLLARGVARLERGRIYEAKEDFIVARERWPEALLPVVLLGQAYVTEGNPEAANELFLRSYESTPARHRPQAARSFSDAFTTGNFTYDDQRLAWLEKVPSGLGIKRALIHVLVNARRSAEAIRVAKERLASDPDDLNAHSNLARAYCQVGQQVLARKHLERVLDVDPHLVPSRTATGDAFFAGRELILSLGEYARGEQAIREALRINPDMLWAPYWISVALQQRGSDARSIEFCETILDAQPFENGLRGRLVALYRRSGDYDSAARWARSGIETAATGGDYRLRLADALWRSTDFEAVEAVLEEALRWSTPGVDDRWARLQLSELRCCSGRRKAGFLLLLELLGEQQDREGLRALRRILAEDPGLASLPSFARLARKLDEDADAEPRDGYGWALLALARVYRGRAEEALAAARKATEVSPKSRTVTTVLADVYAHAGDLVGEIRSLERAFFVLRYGGNENHELLRLDQSREALLPDIASAVSADAIRAGQWRTIVADGETWKYLPGDVVPEGDWVDPDHHDRDWPEGRSPFGQTRGAILRTRLVGARPTGTSIWLRKRFMVEDIASLGEVRLSIACDHGFVAWLNGEEVARVELDPEPWTERDSLARGPVEIEDFSVPLDRLRSGENVLAIRGLAGPEPRDLFLLPMLRGVLSADERRRVIAEFRSLPPTPRRRAVTMYLDGRDHEDAGRFADAARAFDDARQLEPESRELLLAAVRSEREGNQHEAAMTRLERAIEGAGPAEVELVDLWVRTALGPASLSAVEAVARFPLDETQEYTRPHDILWGLREIASSGHLRLNCGAYLERVDAAGREWSRDRFFVGETEARPVGGGSAAWSERRLVDATERQLGPGGAYSIPLPRGTYGVRLRVTGTVDEGEEPRHFTVLVEGGRAFEDVEPGPGIEELRLDGVDVTDGVLDIELEAGVGKPALVTIEVNRA